MGLFDKFKTPPQEDPEEEMSNAEFSALMDSFLSFETGESTSSEAMLKANAVKNTHGFVTYILHDILAVEPGDIKPWSSLYDDLGMDELDLGDILRRICDNVTFRCDSNTFYGWTNSIFDKLNKCKYDARNDNAFMRFTVEQLEKRINEADPISFKLS